MRTVRGINYVHTDIRCIHRRRQPAATQNLSIGNQPRAGGKGCGKRRGAAGSDIKLRGRRSNQLSSHQARVVLRKGDSYFALDLLAGFSGAAWVDRRLGEVMGGVVEGKHADLGYWSHQCQHVLGIGWGKTRLAFHLQRNNKEIAGSARLIGKSPSEMFSCSQITGISSRHIKQD